MKLSLVVKVKINNKSETSYYLEVFLNLLKLALSKHNFFQTIVDVSSIKKKLQQAALQLIFEQL